MFKIFFNSQLENYLTAHKRLLGKTAGGKGVHLMPQGCTQWSGESSSSTVSLKRLWLCFFTYRTILALGRIYQTQPKTTTITLAIFLLLYCHQVTEGRISWAHIIQPLLFWPLTWWDPEPPLSNNGTEWVGGTWPLPLDQDIADTYSINTAFVIDLPPICLMWNQAGTSSKKYLYQKRIKKVLLPCANFSMQLHFNICTLR